MHPMSFYPAVHNSPGLVYSQGWVTFCSPILVRHCASCTNYHFLDWHISGIITRTGQASWHHQTRTGALQSEQKTPQPKVPRSFRGHLAWSTHCEWAMVEVWSLNCNSNSVVVQLALVVEVEEALVVQLALVVQVARPSGCLLAYAAM